MKDHPELSPPKWARKFLHWYCPSSLLEEIEGDLFEAFERNVARIGPARARRRYIIDAVRFFNPTTYRKARSLQGDHRFSSNHLAMFKNYLKIALRNLWRHKGNSAINITGLAIGLAGCLLVGIFVLDEWKFDRYHPDGERIFRITSERTSGQDNSAWASSSPPVTPTMKEEFPEVEQTLRIFQIRQKVLFEKDAQSFLEKGGFFAEPAIFELFDLPLRYGNPATALNEPGSVILSAALAGKYFGGEDPVGQTIQINNNETTVTGVLETLSPHFHLEFDFLFSFQDLLKQVSKERISSWVWQDFYNYIKLKPGTEAESVAAKLPTFVETHAHPQTSEKGFTYQLQLQPLYDIHLHSANLRNDKIRAGNHRYVSGLAIVGLFLLVIACINFINLTTARAIRRSKEVGVRKAAGALRSQLAFQFISEAVVVVSMAMLLAMHLTLLLIPALNNFTGKSLSFPLYSNPLLVVGLIGLTVLTGLLAGMYPAFVISGFRPVQAFKGAQLNPSGSVNWLRKGLIVTQFTLSALLIISVLVIFQQYRYLNNKDLGFHKEHLLHFPMKGKMFRNFDLVREKFADIPGVSSTTIGFGIPGDIVSGDNVIVPGENRRELPARIFTVDHDYIRTMGMEIVAGRDFSQEQATDAGEAFIINETAVKTLGIAESSEAAIGRPLEWEMWTGQDTIKRGRIIGVVKDFHYNSLHEEVQTTVLHIYPGAYWKVALRLHSEDLPATIAGIEQAWNEFETGYPIDYQFVDASFGAMYQQEQKLGNLLWIFTLLAIFIACIGAFGLATYATEQRQKEIGIRKVLGASVTGIIGLLSRDFLKLVFIALLLASPLAWYLMRQWLADFAYRIDIRWWVFLLAGTACLLIAFLTVSYQSIRAALANPVDALRRE